MYSTCPRRNIKAKWITKENWFQWLWNVPSLAGQPYKIHYCHPTITFLYFAVNFLYYFFVQIRNHLLTCKTNSIWLPIVFDFHFWANKSWCGSGSARKCLTKARDTTTTNDGIVEFTEWQVPTQCKHLHRVLRSTKQKNKKKLVCR